MATTKLSSKSLGKVLVQSGEGIPDHIAPLGSIYVDTVSSNLFVNASGGTIWTAAQKVAYGSIFYNDSTQTVALTSTWTKLKDVSGITFTDGEFSGVINTAGALVCNKTPGRFKSTAIVTFQYSAGTAADVEVGISKNGNNPAAGDYSGTTISSILTTNNATAIGTIDLESTDTLQIGIRSTNGSQTVIPLHAIIITQRIGL